MNLLLDTCVWGGARVELQAAGHDVLWTGDLPEDPGDEAILAQAHREQRVLVTLDKDFGELAIIRRLPPAGIIRLVNIPARQQGRVCAQVLGLHGGKPFAAVSNGQQGSRKSVIAGRNGSLAIRGHR
jgi:predicted nuclease of predicted toxin-antitoxin system